MWADQRLLYCAFVCFHFIVQLTLIAAVDIRRSKNIVGAATNHVIASSGCLHNNTMFADTSIIPTSEPCLLCKCSTRNLICVRRVCKDQPYPPPRGCILVHKKNVCCPYLSCEKKHLYINYYKNSNRDHHVNQLDHHHHHHQHEQQQEKTLEKHSRTDDEDVGSENGGCIESGSLYASGSAMVRSSSSMCSYCYCINGQQKCIRPKCLLKDTRCKPIYIDASCCPVKYDCTFNSTVADKSKSSNEKNSLVQRRNRSNGCYENGQFYQEGEKLPTNSKRPCEMCYCIKGFQKCVMKKCAPLIKGCLPKVPADGTCCPTGYDCSRSLKIRRQVRQNDNTQEDDEIDFFSLLFGSDEPQEEIKSEDTTEQRIIASETTTIQPFKILPTTEQTSFFDFIRAGLDIIDKNADKFSSVLTSNFTSTSSPPSTFVDAQTHAKIETTTSTSTTTTTPKVSHHSTTGKTPSTTTKSTTTKIPSTRITAKKTKPTAAASSTITTRKTTKIIGSKDVSMTTMKSQDLNLKVSPTTTTKKPKPVMTSTTRKRIEQTTVKLTPPPTIPPAKLNIVTTKKVQQTTTLPPTKTSTTTRRAITTASTPPAVVVKTSNPYEDYFNVIRHQIPIHKIVNDADNEAEAIPDIEIIPFVAHDAIDHDKFESYHQQHPNPYEESLERDYFAASHHHNTEKPFRYNNKFIQHSSIYDDVATVGGGVEPSVVHGFPNPHERIDNGPYYFETNENQFEAFSPPSEQDFIGGFSPAKETLFENNTPTPFSKKSDEDAQKHSSNDTSSASTLPINQTASILRETAVIDDVIPNFKKISNNFTSYLDNFLHHETSTTTSTTTLSPVTTTKTSKTKATQKVDRNPSTSSTATTTTSRSVVKIDDDDFIRKHIKSPLTWENQQNSQANGVMEIFSRPTTPTMNGLLKLAGCNIYGQMYNVGQRIAELSNECLDCKCLPDIGVGCTPKC